MDTGTFVKIAIGATVLLLVVAAVITPLLNGVTYTKTAQNTPTGYATNSLSSGVYAWSSNGFTIDSDNETPVSADDWILLSDTVTVMRNYNTLLLIDYDGEAIHYGNTVTIDSTERTWTMGSYTGPISNNALIRANSGELGTYLNQEFTIDRNANAKIWCVLNQTIAVEGTNYYARGIISGDIEHLAVDRIALSGYPSFYMGLDASTATASIEDAISSEDYKNITISANPNVSFTVEYNGDTITSGSTTASIAAPVEYLTTVDNGEITTMIGIVPLIMVLGVITMVIGALVIRRS